MAGNISQPTILVKKADGTSERITLQEFKKRQQTASTLVQKGESAVVPPSVPEKPVVSTAQPTQPQAPVRPLVVNKGQVRRPIPLVRVAPKQVAPEQPRKAIPLVRTSPKPVVPVAVTESHLTNTTPVTKIFEQPIATTRPVPVTKKDDHRSLLDEDLSEITRIQDTHKSTHAPIRSVNFSSSVVIPKDLEARTSSLILSWKKGIRDREQFIDYAQKPTAEGGLGLGEAKAQTLFAEISENSTFVEPKKNALHPPKPVLPARPVAPKKLLQQVSTPSSVIREVSQSTSATTVMGPKEEAASFGLEDFRRLSRDPRTAGEMVLSKFSGWKDESYLLYLQVRDSWRTSPLFRLYIEKTLEALQKNTTVAAILESDVLSYEEYLAISEINRKFEMMD